MLSVASQEECPKHIEHIVGKEVEGSLDWSPRYDPKASKTNYNAEEHYRT